MNAATTKAVAYIQGLSEEGFWGAVTLKFQHGEVIHLSKAESILPCQLEPEHRRMDNEQQLAAE